MGLALPEEPLGIPLRSTSPEESHIVSSGAFLRGFGTHLSDIELDLSLGSRPMLVTRLLMNCISEENGGSRSTGSGSTDPAMFFWSLTVGDRIFHLLSLAFPDESYIPLTMICPNADCGESMEVPVERDALFALHRETHPEDRVSATLEDETILLRKPLGSDQKQWLGSSFLSEKDAALAMISTLRMGNGEQERQGKIENSGELPGSEGHSGEVTAPEEPGLSPKWIRAINDAMEEADPLVNFTLTVSCPSCAHESSHVADLEGIALSRLREKQHHLLRTVHALASHYHWTEQEILSLPPWRRSHYLSLIGRQKAV